MILNKKAFLTVEVLISIVIIFIAIVTMTSSIKLNINFDKKKEFYETLYISVKSVQNYLKYMDVDTLENNLQNKEPNSNGFNVLALKDIAINGFDIVVKYKKVRELRNFVYDEYQGGKNSGEVKHFLYQFKLYISKDYYEKDYTFYIHKYKDTM